MSKYYALVTDIHSIPGYTHIYIAFFWYVSLAVAFQGYYPRVLRMTGDILGSFLQSVGDTVEEFTHLVMSISTQPFSYLTW